MASRAGAAVHYLDLSACGAVRLKRRQYFQGIRIRPEICFISASNIIIEHDRPLKLYVGERLDLQLYLAYYWFTLRCRVVWAVQEELWKSDYSGYTWFQYGLELESPLHPQLFQLLALGAKKYRPFLKPAS